METLETMLTVFAASCGVGWNYFRSLDALENDDLRIETKLKYQEFWKSVASLELHTIFLKLVNDFLFTFNLEQNLHPKLKESGIDRPFLMLFLVVSITGCFGYFFLSTLHPYKLDLLIILLFIYILTVYLVLHVIYATSKKFPNLSLVGLFGNIVAVEVMALHFSGIGGFIPRVSTFGFFILFKIAGGILTVFITFRLLAMAIREENAGFTVLIILIDILTTFTVAFGSTYFGFLGTNHSLSILEVWNVLFYKLRDGSSFAINNYTFLSHTTFIPTIIYLSILLLLVIAKYPVSWITIQLKKVSVADRPHYATATTFAWFGSVSGLIALLLLFL